MKEVFNNELVLSGTLLLLVVVASYATYTISRGLKTKQRRNITKFLCEISAGYIVAIVSTIKLYNLLTDLAPYKYPLIAYLMMSLGLFFILVMIIFPVRLWLKLHSELNFDAIQSASMIEAAIAEQLGIQKKDLYIRPDMYNSFVFKTHLSGYEKKLAIYQVIMHLVELVTTLTDWSVDKIGILKPLDRARVCMSLLPYIRSHDHMKIFGPLKRIHKQYMNNCKGLPDLCNLNPEVYVEHFLVPLLKESHHNLNARYENAYANLRLYLNSTRRTPYAV